MATISAFSKDDITVTVVQGSPPLSAAGTSSGKTVGVALGVGLAVDVLNGCGIALPPSAKAEITRVPTEPIAATRVTMQATLTQMTKRRCRARRARRRSSIADGFEPLMVAARVRWGKG
ncbi:hypothetical protein GCM10009777_06680 [Microbacterium pumilum]|uniref:Uncharacterized protein n=1 Tax=Microbacterium pumilum TaxID=344165 RepID=A0ABN2RY34_9MICO